MLMAMAGLFRAGLVEWVSAMTYQAASGAGAKHMRELVSQMGVVHGAAAADARGSVVRDSRDRSHGDRHAAQRRSARPSTSAIRWRAACCPGSTRTSGNGQSREEWKAMAEANKILGRPALPIPDRRHLRADRRDALPQPGADREADDATSRCATSRRMLAGAHEWVRRRAQRARRKPARADARRRVRHAARADRPPPQAGDGAGVPDRRSPWATSCSGAPPSRCAACSASSWASPRTAPRGTSDGGVSWLVVVLVVGGLTVSGYDCSIASRQLADN